MPPQGQADTETESCWGSSLIAHPDCTALGWPFEAFAGIQCFPSLHSMAWRQAQGAQSLLHTSGSVGRLLSITNPTEVIP